MCFKLQGTLVPLASLESEIDVPRVLPWQPQSDSPSGSRQPTVGSLKLFSEQVMAGRDVAARGAGETPARSPCPPLGSGVVYLIRQLPKAHVCWKVLDRYAEDFQRIDPCLLSLQDFFLCGMGTSISWFS